MGSGTVLFDMVITLSRSYNPNEAKENISKKINALQEGN